MALILSLLSLLFGATSAHAETSSVEQKASGGKVSHWAVEARLASDAKTGTITDSAGVSASVYYRGIGIDVCGKGSHFLTESATFFDITRLCAGYSYAQLDSSQLSGLNFNYFEQSVNSYPLSLEPGFEVAVNNDLFFFFNGSVRTIITQTRSNANYSLSGIESFHLGLEGGFDARVHNQVFFNIGFESFFSNGFSFFTGASVQL